MPEYFQLADIVAQPSELAGLSLVYLEAPASGGALLASDIPGAQELIGNRKTGVVVPLADIDALTAATLRLASDAALRTRMGRRRARMSSRTTVQEIGWRATRPSSIRHCKTLNLPVVRTGNRVSARIAR